MRTWILQEFNFIIILEYCSFLAIRVRDCWEMANGALEDSQYEIFYNHNIECAFMNEG
jgi:hypothetical protein